MNDKILNFFSKHSINTEEIKYIIRKDKKTCIYLSNDKIFFTYITVKEFLSFLEAYDFICINKGIIVCKKQIDYINNGVYHMIDGQTFQGRKRTIAEHKHLNEALHENFADKLLTINNIRRKFSILDNMPIAFCIIELVFNEDGHGIDFIFRYCNKEMEIIEGKTIYEMLDHSFYKVFPNADKKWLTAYTDVALNGSFRYIRDFSPEINKEIFVRCFQPIEGFCACLITPADDLAKALPATHIE